MSYSLRSRRPNQSPLNTPVASRVISSTPLTAEEAQVQLDAFIAELENVAHGLDGFNPAEASDDMIISNQSKYTGLDSSILNQLKRVQRDLRGLPPLLSEAKASNGATSATKSTSAAPANKKIVFGDDESSAPQPNKKIVFEEVVSTEESKDVEEPVVELIEEEKEETKPNLTASGIDKEERKRLKKERRKEEKRLKMGKA